MRSSVFLLAVAATVAPTLAQTSTTCNPTKKQCPDDPALGKSVFYDFTKGASQDFTVSTGAAPKFDGNGAEFTIAKSGDSPTLTSKWYMMFGHYDIVMKAAPGVGVVSSVVLQSDDLDEIDLEWLGADDQHVQSNYYGKGNTAVYDRGANLTNPGSQDDFHTYSVDYTADHITWSIDGQVLRTLTPQTADANQYPQSPMQLKIGSWPAGDPAEPAGTIAWSGGPIDYTKGPFTFTVKSVKAIDYSSGTSYSYSDTTGNWQSIKSNGGQVNSKGSDNSAAVSTASAGGSTVTAVTSAVISNVPITATTTNTGELSTATGSLATASGTGGIVPPSPSGSSNSTGSGSGSGSGNSTVGGGSGSSGSGGSGPSPTSSSTGTISTGMASEMAPRMGASFGLVGALVAALVL